MFEYRVIAVGPFKGCVVTHAERLTQEAGIKKDGRPGAVQAQPGRFVCDMRTQDGTKEYRSIILREDMLLPPRVELQYLPIRKVSL